MNAKAPVFPVNTRWSTPLDFRPRETSYAIQNMLAETLIRNDNAIRQLLRQCKDKWIFAVTLGQDTIYLKVFNPQDVNQSHLRPVSSSINRARTAFFEVDRDFNVRTLSPERIDEVMRTAPMLYTDRGLTRDEISTCNSVQRSMSGETNTLGDIRQQIDEITHGIDELRPDFTLEPTSCD